MQPIALTYDHISLTVSSVGRSMDFYSKYFGFRLARRDVATKSPKVDFLTGVKGSELIAIFLTNDNLVLELVEFVTPRGAERAALMNAVGAPHIAFVVPDVSSAYNQLQAEGVEFISEPVFSSTRQNYSIMLRDPDGIMIELRESPALKSVQGTL